MKLLSCSLEGIFFPLNMPGDNPRHKAVSVGCHNNYSDFRNELEKLLKNEVVAQFNRLTIYVCKWRSIQDLERS